MNIKFSRHSIRRLKLYNIDESDIINEIKDYLKKHKLLTGKVQLVESAKSKFKYIYPLKIVFEKNLTEVIIITIYPLKKGKR